MSAAKKNPSDEALDGARARDEAVALLADLEQQLATLTTFVTEEKRATKRKAPSPKRLARLRLVAEDVASAARLAGKAVKS